jgi:hypothetical protein
MEETELDGKVGSTWIVYCPHSSLLELTTC